jgi:hypothetical protein
MGAGKPPPTDDGPTIPAGVVCATAPKIKNAFEAIRESAPAQTRDVNRIFKGVPVQAEIHLISGAAYNGRIRNFNPSDRGVLT